MGTNEVIRDVGKTLKKLLEGIISSDKITLSSPEDINDEELSLFLYRIIEDPHLKNESPEINYSGNNLNNLDYPPLYLKLFYLITANKPKKVRDYYVEDEHILMGKIMQIFHDNPILRGSILQGSLKGSELRLILNPLSVDELNKIWNMISKSKPYKLSISLEITPVMIESKRKQKVKRVIERKIKYNTWAAENANE